jgi:hypothetical protein
MVLVAVLMAADQVAVLVAVLAAAGAVPPNRGNWPA